jgi:hypothetical protein
MISSHFSTPPLPTPFVYISPKRTPFKQPCSTMHMKYKQAAEVPGAQRSKQTSLLTAVPNPQSA